MYALKCDAINQAVWDSLPQPVSEALTTALAGVCENPLGATKPYGEDDGIMRMLVLADVLVVIYLGHQSKTVNVFQIDSLD